MSSDGDGVARSPGRLREELASLGRAQELDLLNKILTDGLDQGCFVRPPTDALIHGAGECETLLDGSAGREAMEASVDDPFRDREIPHLEPSGERPGYVVLTQRCDLVRGLRDEPMVELARARLVDRSSPLRVQAKRNSPRYLFLCDAEDGSWIVDLRSRASLPKHRLPECGPSPLALAPGRARSDFRLRLGQRYSRDAVPDDVVRDLQWPLAKWFDKNSGRRKQADMFSAFLVQRLPDGLLLVGVIGPGHDRKAAERAFREMREGLVTEAALNPQSGAVTTEDIPLSLYLDSYKLSLDELSRGSKAGESTEPPIR